MPTRRRDAAGDGVEARRDRARGWWSRRHRADSTRSHSWLTIHRPRPPPPDGPAPPARQRIGDVTRVFDLEDQLSRGAQKRSITVRAGMPDRVRGQLVDRGHELLGAVLSSPGPPPARRPILAAARGRRPRRHVSAPPVEDRTAAAQHPDGTAPPPYADWTRAAGRGLRLDGCARASASTSSSRLATSYGHRTRTSAFGQARLISASWRVASRISSSLAAGPDRLGDEAQRAAPVPLDHRQHGRDDPSRVSPQLGHVEQLDPAARSPSFARSRFSFGSGTATATGSSPARARDR